MWPRSQVSQQIVNLPSGVRLPRCPNVTMTQCRKRPIHMIKRPENHMCGLRNHMCGLEIRCAGKLWIHRAEWGFHDVTMSRWHNVERAPTHMVKRPRKHVCGLEIRCLGKCWIYRAEWGFHENRLLRIIQRIVCKNVVVKTYVKDTEA